MELKCDARVCKNMDEEEKTMYLQGILQIIKMGKKGYMELGVGFGNGGSGKFMQRRFQEVLNPVKKISYKMTLVSAGTCLLVFILSYTVILQPKSLPSIEELVEISDEANGEEITEFLVS